MTTELSTSDAAELADLMRTFRIDDTADLAVLIHRLEWYMNRLAGHRLHDYKAREVVPNSAGLVNGREAWITRLDRMLKKLKSL